MNPNRKLRIKASPPPERDLSSGPILFLGAVSPLSPGENFGFSRHRPGYSRVYSNDTREDEGKNETAPEAFYKSHSTNASAIGLGLGSIGDNTVLGSSSEASRTIAPTIARKSVGTVGRKTTIAQPQWSPETPESPKSSKASIRDPSPHPFGPPSPEVHQSQAPFELVEYSAQSGASKPSQYSFHERTNTAQFEDDVPLKSNAGAPSIRSVRSAFDNDYNPRNGCPAAYSFEHSRRNWFGMSMFMLSVFSTIFSGIYFVLAARGPRYGHLIGTNARLSSSTASILTTLFAKLIELSYVTVFVAFVGQALSRRAFMARERGVSLAELSMRAWIMQPGSLITNYQTLRYAALTVLGACCLTAALVALLYTTAADALGGFDASPTK